MTFITLLANWYEYIKLLKTEMSLRNHKNKEPLRTLYEAQLHSPYAP